MKYTRFRGKNSSLSSVEAFFLSSNVFTLLLKSCSKDLRSNSASVASELSLLDLLLQLDKSGICDSLSLFGGDLVSDVTTAIVPHSF
jgi:hypothetical protein